MTDRTIFSQRKDLKKKAHQVVKHHYFLLAFLMLIMTLFGTEFGTSLSGWGKTPLSLLEEEDPENPGTFLSDRDALSPGQILSDIVNGDIGVVDTKAKERAEALQEKFSTSKALGMTNGILAQAVNGFMSGKLYVQLIQTIRTVTRSDQAAAIIFTIGAFLWYALVFFLLKNVYSAVIRRAFLAARIYQHLAVSDVTWFAIVRKWLSACRVMLVKEIYLFLWNFTIVGGLIKQYSYWAVPYIVAENPAVSAKEAIRLSRRMMNGHKLELFKYELTFAGWWLLSLVTYGISDLVYGNAYRLAAGTEYYAMLREEMRKTDPECAAILNDSCLYQCPDRVTLAEAYFDVVEEITILYENKVTLEGWKKKVSDWFGVWLSSSRKKKLYDRQEEGNLALQHDKRCMQGLSYPQRLSPLWENRRASGQGNFSFIRSYTVWTLILLFISFCFIGWSWEVALHFMQTGQFANRGTLHGPWLPIYGSGGIIVLLLCSRFRKNPVAEFITAIVLCGVLEYVSAWSLEMKYHQRWWSYDGYFLNLHGRICAEGLLVFGVGCCAVVYFVAPAFDHMISKLNQKVIVALCVILGALYATDVIYSMGHPNMAEGAVESAAETEEVETDTAPEESGTEGAVPGEAGTEEGAESENGKAA